MLEKLKEKDKQLMQLRDNNKELTKLNKVNRNIKKIKRKKQLKRNRCLDSKELSPGLKL